MSPDTLHSLVTAAIWRAEQLEEHGVSSALAWGDVSALEEELAAVFSVAQAEGRIARRGAVRAALEARDYGRADTLAERYTAAQDVPESLAAAIREILEEDARSLASRFRYASGHQAVDDARNLARRLHQAGPFGLAA